MTHKEAIEVITQLADQVNGLWATHLKIREAIKILDSGEKHGIDNRNQSGISNSDNSPITTKLAAEKRHSS